MGKIYESKASFRACVNGQDVTVRRGDTVREGHPLLANNQGHFRLLVPRFEYTPPPPPEKPKPLQAPKPPPATKAPAKPASAGAKADDEG